MPDVEALLTSKQAAETLGITIARWHHLVDADRITPAHQLPGATGAMLFHRTDVERLADELTGDNGAAA